MNFNLSEKIVFGGLSQDKAKLDDDHAVIRRKDVKEFIRRLKKVFCLSEETNCRCSRCIAINKLAGDKLIISEDSA